MEFKKVIRENLNLRMAICGPTGSGKTFSALGIACEIAASEGSRVAVIDTERHSSNRYADKFDFDGVQLESFAPEKYIEAIDAANKAGYKVLVIDSLSHAWEGEDGMLEKVDAIAKRSASKNSFQAWAEGTPIQRRFINTILDYPGHIIVTMRVKTEWVMEANDRGKMAPRKVGLSPVQRQGIEYEFDLVGDMDENHCLVLSKTRASALDGKIYQKPGKKFAEEIIAWTKSGKKQEPAKEKPKAEEPLKQQSEPPKQEPPKQEQPKQEPPAQPKQETNQTGKQVAEQNRKLRELSIKCGAKSQDEIRELIGNVVGRQIASALELSQEEREIALAALTEEASLKDQQKEAA